MKVKPGDRVAVYEGIRKVGEVDRVYENTADVCCDGVMGNYCLQQLRRLVKKKPEEYLVRHCTGTVEHDAVYKGVDNTIGRYCPHCQVFRVRRLRGEK